MSNFIRIFIANLAVAALLATYLCVSSSNQNASVAQQSGLRKMQSDFTNIRAPVGNGFVIKPITGDKALINAALPPPPKSSPGQLGQILSSPLQPAPPDATGINSFNAIQQSFAPYFNFGQPVAPTKTQVSSANGFATGALAAQAFAANPFGP
jgi:hypothetical protein